MSSAKCCSFRLGLKVLRQIFTFSFKENGFESIVRRLAAISSRPQYVNMLMLICWFCTACYQSAMWYPLPWFLVVTLAWPCEGHVPGRAVNDTLSLAFLGTARALPGALPAISVALKEVERRELLPGYNVEWRFLDSNCNPYTGWMKIQIQLQAKCFFFCLFFVFCNII